MSTFLNVLLLVGVGMATALCTTVAELLGHRGKPWWAEAWWGLNMVVNVIFAAVNLAAHRYGWIPLFAGVAVYDGWQWWKWHNQRKKKKPVGSLVGAKTKALIDGLVRKQREATVPTR